MSGNKGKTQVPTKPATGRDIAHRQPSEQSGKVVNKSNNVRPPEPVYSATTPSPRKK